MIVTDIDKILRIKNPEQLFSIDNIKEEYRKLALIWHPDKNGNKDVFAHITNLYKEGLNKIKLKYWDSFGLLRVEDRISNKFNIKYLYKEPFELGTMYVGNTVVVYEVRKEYEKLYRAFAFNVDNFKYKTPEMKKEFSKYLPDVAKYIETDNSNIIVIRKTQDVLPLSVVLKYFNGAVDPKSVAWILSRLHNIHCFLQYNGIVHNDISLSTVFISPEHHSALLLGGWWYTKEYKKPLIGIPTYAYDFMTPKFKADKLSDYHVDSELIRLLARTLLGDKHGTTLVSKFKVPKEFTEWVRLPGSRSPVNDYESWQGVLAKSFGERKFFPMVIDINEAYNKSN